MIELLGMLRETWRAWTLGRASARQMNRGREALERGETRYMRLSSYKYKQPLLYAGGVVYEEIALARDHLVRLPYRRATRRERRRYG